MAARRAPGRVSAPPAARIERRVWNIASDVHAIEPIVKTVQALCTAAGFSPSHCRLNIPVAITEAISNAIISGNANQRARSVQVVIALESHCLTVEVSDEGAGFDMAQEHRAPDDADWLDREDGRGLFLMRSLMDAVESVQPTAQRRHTMRLILHRA